MILIIFSDVLKFYETFKTIFFTLKIFTFETEKLPYITLNRYIFIIPMCTHFFRVQRKLKMREKV